MPLYCTPFFARCKEKIYKFYANFEKFFDREGKNGKNTTFQLPQKRKNRPQKKTEGQFFQNTTGEKTEGIAQPQVAAADGKAQVQPSVEKSGQKQKICQTEVITAHRPQCAVANTQKQSKQAGQQKSTDIGGGCVH